MRLSKSELDQVQLVFALGITSYKLQDALTVYA